MKTNPDIAAQTARFAEAVSAFTPVCKARYAKLLPFRDGIAQLREKGASYDLIREMLVAAGVTVAVDTIGNFVREVIEQRERPQPNPRRRPQPRPFAAHPAPTVGATKMPFTVAPPAGEAPDGSSPAAPAPARRARALRRCCTKSSPMSLLGAGCALTTKGSIGRRCPRWQSTSDAKTI